MGCRGTRTYSHRCTAPRVSVNAPPAGGAVKATTCAAGHPDRFPDLAHADQWCHAFCTHDNTAHRHSSLAYCTPAMVHGGTAPAILTKRHDTMRTASAQHPARFVRGAPTPCALPAAVSLNPIAEEHAAVVAAQYTPPLSVSYLLTGSACTAETPRAFSSSLPQASTRCGIAVSFPCYASGTPP